MPGPITNASRPVAVRDIAHGEAVAQTGSFEGRDVAVDQARPRAQGILERAWSAISSFVKSVAGLFSRAAPAPAQPRAADAGAQPGEVAPLPQASDAQAGDPPRLSLSVNGQLEGEAAKSFERKSILVIAKDSTANTDGICHTAAKDWGRNDLVIGGQTFNRDLKGSTEKLLQLTGGDERMLLRISQFANQNPFAAVVDAMRQGHCRTEHAGGISLVPGQCTQVPRYQIDAHPEGGFQIRYEVAYENLESILNVETSEMQDCDPEQSRMDYSFCLRIAPDGTASVAEPLNFNVQLRSPD